MNHYSALPFLLSILAIACSSEAPSVKSPVVPDSGVDLLPDERDGGEGDGCDGDGVMVMVRW